VRGDILVLKKVSTEAGSGLTWGRRYVQRNGASSRSCLFTFEDDGFLAHPRKGKDCQTGTVRGGMGSCLFGMPALGVTGEGAVRLWARWGRPLGTLRKNDGMSRIVLQASILFLTGKGPNQRERRLGETGPSFHRAVMTGWGEEGGLLSGGC